MTKTSISILLTLLTMVIMFLVLVSCEGDDGYFDDDGSRRCDNAVTDSGSVTCGGQTYKTVKIGSQTWMAENLNFNTNGSACYRNNSVNCATYGRLYNWYTARAVCPDGWHLPSDDEWTTLTNFVGNDAGIKLKAKNGWNGTDDYDFSALPGGFGIDKDNFLFIDNDGWWWSGTHSFNMGSAVFRCIYKNSRNVGRGLANNSILYSVRCIQTPMGTEQ